MKTEINVEISKNGFIDFKNPNNDDRWKKSEIMCGCIFKENIINNEVALSMHIEDPKQQVEYGDYLIVYYEKSKTKFLFLECKSCSTDPLTGEDRQHMDYRYCIRGSNFTLPYNQSTGDDIGWLELNKSNVLITYNYKNDNLYVIDRYKTVKANILTYMDDYYNTHDISKSPIEEQLTNGLWIRKSNHENSKKDTVNALLRLEKDTIEALGGILLEYHVNFIID